MSNEKKHNEFLALATTKINRVGDRELLFLLTEMSEKNGTVSTSYKNLGLILDVVTSSVCKRMERLIAAGLVTITNKKSGSRNTYKVNFDNFNVRDLNHSLVLTRAYQNLSVETPASRQVYLILANKADNAGRVNICPKAVSRLVFRELRTVQRSINILIQRGLIQRVSRHNYQLLFTNENVVLESSRSYAWR